jgi:hypothetical protein
LSHDLNYLKKIKIDILGYSITKQAEYSDAITQEHSQDQDFLAQQVTPLEKITNEELEKVYTTTAIGNLAFLALNSPKPYNEIFGKKLEEFVIFMKNKKPKSNKRPAIVLLLVILCALAYIYYESKK